MSARTENVIVIDAPLDEVWARTNDVRTWPTLFSEYASIDVLAETENYVRFRLTMKPDDNGKVWAWVSERRLDPELHIVDAVRVETGPFEYMTIRWEYTEVDGGVEMRWRQDFAMKASAPVTDNEMARRIDTNSPREMNRIKTVLEQSTVEQSTVEQSTVEQEVR